MKQCDVEVRGAGIVGSSLALALARIGLAVRLRSDPSTNVQAAPDVRAFALNAASLGLLQQLKVWDNLPPGCRTPVREMVVQGDAAGSMLEFTAWQQRLSELAWIVDAPALESALASALRHSPHVEQVTEDAGAGAPTAALIAVCEGKYSHTRGGLGVALDKRAYGHSAIAARVVAESAHQGRARQWFRAPDVLALLPFDLPEPARSYAIVWSMPDLQKDELMQLDETGFAARLADIAGEPLRLASERASWPLSHAVARSWSGPGWVLLGDAAHVVHPLAGQGLNLGLGDVLALARVIAQREPWRSLGDDKLLRRYVRERAAPTWAMSQMTDGLLNLFAHPDPSLRELRNRGMDLVNRLTPLKRWLAERALDDRSR